MVTSSTATRGTDFTYKVVFLFLSRVKAFKKQRAEASKKQRLAEQQRAEAALDADKRLYHEDVLQAGKLHKQRAEAAKGDMPPLIGGATDGQQDDNWGENDGVDALPPGVIDAQGNEHGEATGGEPLKLSPMEVVNQMARITSTGEVKGIFGADSFTHKAAKINRKLERLQILTAQTATCIKNTELLLNALKKKKLSYEAQETALTEKLSALYGKEMTYADDQSTYFFQSQIEFTSTIMTLLGVEEEIEGVAEDTAQGTRQEDGEGEGGEPPQGAQGGAHYEGEGDD